MKHEPWVCNLRLPFLAPPGRDCYMETGWDGRKGARVLQAFSPQWGWRKRTQERGQPAVPNSSVGQDKVVCWELDTPLIQEEVAGRNRGAPWSHLPPSYWAPLPRNSACWPTALLGLMETSKMSLCLKTCQHFQGGKRK